MISIIIPVYNAKAYIDECINSVLQQSSNDFELILVDDQSVDGSGNICDQYAERDSRVHCFHQENMGSYYARKKGIEKAKGEYIWLVDADDYVHPGSINEINTIVQSYNPDIIQFNYSTVSCNGTNKLLVDLPGRAGFYDTKRIHEEIFPTLFYKEGFYRFGVNPSLWNKVFRRELLIKHIGDVDRSIFMGEDGLVTYQCYLNAGSVYILGDYYYYYRINETSICGTASRRDLFGQNIPLFARWEKILALNPSRTILVNSYSSYVFFMMWQAMEAVFVRLKQDNADSIQVIRTFGACNKVLSKPELQKYMKRAKFSRVSFKRRIINALFLHKQYRLLFALWRIDRITERNE